MKSGSKSVGSSPKRPSPQLGLLGSVQKDVGDDRNPYFRADTIDFKKWDSQLEKHLAKALSIGRKDGSKMEEWEIDLGKLEMGEVVDHGSYGSVYKGVYDHQDVAVKVLDWGEDGHASAAKISALRASFRQEVAVWHKLDHPNITKFIGASMGASDLKIPSRNDTNPPQNPIVHRDLKTENLLLDSNRTLKIAGFEVARVEAQNPSDMTGETGTLGCMAPEVLDGKPYNRKCDVYSFGICSWEIYCCDMPYADLSFAEVSSAVVHKHSEVLSELVFEHFEEVLGRESGKALEAIDTGKGGGMIKPSAVFAFTVAVVLDLLRHRHYEGI
ncbi:hypothetical protein L6452_38193 [Arctium lappa]|uniref:Uncharacterized protein n=1 Tax=Arctium lappa TaxID=4217 RepID=A0ACB8Y670_ARCLA|nr:hypothetical protein L6452_38193 [Arctium lappa]